jgi:hypothetical protein
MFAESTALTLACVLFVQMGLSNALQEKLHVRLRILSCPKCFTFWSVLALTLASGNDLLGSVVVSFVCSYFALWLSLLYDYLATIYNKVYESITQTTDAKTVPDANQAGSTDEVSKM